MPSIGAEAGVGERIDGPAVGVEIAVAVGLARGAGTAVSVAVGVVVADSRPPTSSQKRHSNQQN